MGKAWWWLAGVAMVAAACSPGTDTPPTDVPTDETVGDSDDGTVETDGDDGTTDADGTDDGSCTPAEESCNDLDDDCDGLTDEDFDLTADPMNCGECGATCAPAHAMGNCTGSACQIVACNSGWVDLNRSAVDGCEYECTSTTTAKDDTTCENNLDDDCDGRTDETDTDCSPCVPELCNRGDDDCDGLTDEDFDLDFDGVNCGACGTVCRGWPNADPVCILGACDYVCRAGFSDANGVRADGCESGCTATGSDETACDGVDSDCDGLTDEDHVYTFCGEGICRRRSFCNRGVETCVPRAALAPTDLTCDHVDDDCDGATDDDTTCICYSDAECDDGNPCNGVESCTIGVGCNSGVPPNCDDGVDCTDDSCNPLDGTCGHTPNATLCDDGDHCDGEEICDLTAGCLENTPVNCDDAIDCTLDSCVRETGACTHSPLDSACQDGVFCNGAETCDPSAGCRAGTAPNCSDGILCTEDTCSPGVDACVNTPINSRCDDGQFCNGPEQCQVGIGCGPGATPTCNDGLSCTTDTCDPGASGGAGACVFTPPDADRDGFPPVTCLGTDCNDSDGTIYPGASERCNALDDDCDGSTDETFSCIRGASGSCTVGACSGSRTCSATCSWGTCAVLASELCNGVDDNCNGSTDEGFSCQFGTTRACTLTVPSKTCTGTQTCVSGCTWGACVIPASGSNIETCNSVDDNCNGTVDEAPPAPYTLCSAVPNATTGCSTGSCRITGCNSGWADPDAAYGNGCECALESPEPPGTSCSATSLGTFNDTPYRTQTVTGKLATAGDVDCYSFTANDVADSTCDDFRADIRFTTMPSSEFVIDVYRGTCSTSVCSGSPDYYSWYTDFRSGSGTTATGECGCRTASTLNYNLCTNNSATFYFCVRRASGGPTCNNYSIEVSNGRY